MVWPGDAGRVGARGCHAGLLEVGAQVSRQREGRRFGLGACHLDGGESAVLQPFDDLAHEDLGHGRAGGETHGAGALEPGGLEFLGLVDPVCGPSPGLERDLDEAHRVRGVRRSDDDHDVHLGRDVLDGDLAVLGGVADVVRRRVDELGEALAQAVHRLAGLVHGQRGLGDPHDARGVAHDDVVHLVGSTDDLDVVGCLAEGTLDLLVALMAHQDDVVVLLREAHGLAVNLGHERAGRVDRGEVTGGGGHVDGRGDAVRGEDDASALGDFVSLLHEDRAALSQRLDDELVVDDLLAHVHGRAVQLEGLLDDVDGAVHSGAVSAGSRQEDAAIALAVGGGQGGLGAGAQVDVLIHASTLAPTARGVRALVAIPHALIDEASPPRPVTAAGARGTRHPLAFTQIVTGGCPQARGATARLGVSCGMLSGVTLPDTPAAPPPGGSPQPRLPAAKAADTTRDNPWPLRRLTENIKVYVDRMSPLWVEGQVVEYKVRPGAKMHFLTLRDLDTDTSMTVTAWAGVMDSTPLTEGARVVTRVKPVFWERSGRLNLQAAEIHLQGVGDLLAQIEALRARLAAEGLFSDARKKPLPFLPRTIGLICGRNAKAKDDVVVNASDRWPTARFEIREVAVQGDHCVPEVGRALLELDAMEGVDVIVIARGGGSVEDLLPFSDERLVRAVADARTPIVSAIGHEGDSPLLDLVADYRASTPTDAARRIVPDRARERDGITQSLSRMRGALGARLATERSNLTLIASRPVLQGPEAIVEGHRAALTQRVTALRSAIERRLSSERQRLTRSRATLTALSPQATLDRGYALLKTPSGTLITSSAQVKKGDLIEGILASGRMVAQVVGATTPTPPPDATPQDA